MTRPAIDELDFGFVFSRVLSFYAMSFRELMSIPIKTFWMLDRNIDRVMAQRDMRDMTVAISSQGQEAAQSYRDALVMEIGTTMTLKAEDPILSAVRDEEGFAALREMAKQTI